MLVLNFLKAILKSDKFAKSEKTNLKLSTPDHTKCPLNTSYCLKASNMELKFTPK